MTLLDLPVRPLTPLLEMHLGAGIRAAQRLHGGDISDTFRLDTTRGPFVLKTSPQKAGGRLPDGFYAAEAHGLGLLRPGPLVTPDVIAHGSGPAGQPYLLLSWLPPGDDTPAAQDALGRGLAALHARPAPGFGGLPDNYFASLPQRNPPAASAAEFFWTARLEPLLNRERLHLTPRDRAGFDTLRERLPDLILPEPPALVHGDLWHGNVHYTPRGPALIDPAVGYSHREVDVAALRLFGGVPRRVFQAYHEAYPLADGWEARVPLWNLYPLLAHLLLFGEGYLGRTREALHAALDPQ